MTEQRARRGGGEKREARLGENPPLEILIQRHARGADGQGLPGYFGGTDLHSAALLIAQKLISRRLGLHRGGA